jgi:hypothetical protein
MAQGHDFLSTLIVGYVDSKNIALIGLALDFEGCPLTGAWETSSLESKESRNLIQDKVLIPFPNDFESLLRSRVSNEILEFEVFLRGASELAQMDKVRFNSFVSEEPKSRAKLVAPDFFNWQAIENIKNHEQIAKELGLGFFEVTERNSLSDIIGYARLFRWIFLRWQNDESQREGRESVFPGFSRRLLPIEI